MFPYTALEISTQSHHKQGEPGVISRATGIFSELLEHFCITFISDTDPPCVSEQSRVKGHAGLSACNRHIRAETTFKTLKVDPDSLFETLLKLTADICKRKHLKPLLGILKNRKKHKCGSGDTDWESETATLTAPRCTSSLFVYFLSGVNIYAWLQPSHLHMSHPANTLRASTNIPQLSGTHS